MSKKILHVREGVVVAISFPNEPVNAYGELVEVESTLEIGVGDSAPVDVPAAPRARKAKAE